VNSLSDNLIIDKILDGNTNAYSALVNRYKNRVFTLAYNVLLNKEDAEEVAQDAFVKAFSALKNFKKQAAFGTWLYRIVINTALNKKKLKKVFTVDASAIAADDEPIDFYSLLKQYENKDLKKFIQYAMQSLNDDERICITLFYLNELQVNEIHELTGQTVANIKVILYRGRKHLYEALQSQLKHETKNLI
jgi:RNA polymerase sigma-70 factor (ECF subfamily)